MTPSFTWELTNPQLSSSTNIHDKIFMPYPEHWRKWEFYLCEEWNSGHNWIADLYTDEFGKGLDVYCDNCPIASYDLLPEASLLTYGTLGNVTIDNGQHNSTEDIVLKVNVELHVEKYEYYEPEYDVWIELTLRQ